MQQQDIEQLYTEQLEEWPDFKERVLQLNDVEYRIFDFDNYQIKAQCNPARAVSSNAKLDKDSIAARKCFLCPENRPTIQRKLILNENFTLLINPFPILKKHFTIPLNEHKNQEIYPYFEDMLDFAFQFSEYTFFYNGPKCGASAPDHMHFQSVKKGQLPFESEYKKINKKILSENNWGKMEELLNYGRKCILIRASKKEIASSFFYQLYTQLQMISGKKEEPMMNIFSFYENEQWNIFIFPRKKHRPDQFFAEGKDYKMISPGAIDIAGILVLPRKEDFDSIDKETITDILKQVSL